MKSVKMLVFFLILLKGAQLKFACKHKMTHSNSMKKNHIFVSKMSFVLEFKRSKKEKISHIRTKFIIFNHMERKPKMRDKDHPTKSCSQRKDGSGRNFIVSTIF